MSRDRSSTPPLPGRARSGGASLTLAELAGGVVRRVGTWAVGLTRVGPDGDEVPFAVSRRCRHQLGDLSKGTVDTDGCLVCPWHGARYDVSDGRMVRGPRGFLGYHGPTPGYGRLVRAGARLLPLRRASAVVRDGRVHVDRTG